LTAQRAEAIDIFANQPYALSKLNRAVDLVMMDEINLIREWLMSFKSATAAATTLATFQSGVAALPSMPDRTPVQAKTAVQNKVNSGAVD
jgi:hypothetical protein